MLWACASLWRVVAWVMNRLIWARRREVRCGVKVVSWASVIKPRPLSLRSSTVCGREDSLVLMAGKVLEFDDGASDLFVPGHGETITFIFHSR